MELQLEDSINSSPPPALSEEQEDGQEESGQERRVSMYVSAFEEMLEVVLKQESYLFTTAELGTFNRYMALSYNARYLLIRLLLRLPRLHRLDQLTTSYAAEIGDGISDAMDELCTPFGNTNNDEASSSSNFKVPAIPPSKNEPDVIDLTEDEEKADPHLARALRESLKGSNTTNTPSSTLSSSSSATASSLRKGKGKAEPPPAKPLSAEILAALSLESKELVLTEFCSPADRVREDELLRCLRLDELKEVAKAMKVWRNGQTYDNLIQVLMKTATNQSILSFPVLPSPRSTASTSNVPKSIATTPKPLGKSLVRSNTTPTVAASKQSTLSFGGTPLAKKVDGRARLAQQVRKVAGKMMTVNEDVRLLWKRVNLIFYRSTVTPPSLLLPQILTKSNRRVYPDYTPTRTTSLFPTRQALITYEQALLLETEVDDALGEQETLNGRRPFSKKLGVQGGENASGATGGGGKFGYGSTLGRKEGAEVVKGIWEMVWDRWKQLVKEAKATGGEGTGARVVADRFTPGHVLTRIVYKGATALGVLHEYEAECEVLKALLAQKVWRRGRRGAWYERLALIYMTHFKGDDATEKKEEALDVCMDGLEDEDTHLIYRPSLARRLARLEKQLKIPLKECHRCEGELKTCEIVTLVAKRIRKQEPENDAEDDQMEEGSNRARSRSMSRGARGKTEEGGGEVKKTTWGAKSAWAGRDGTSVGVEQWVLEQWEAKGWRGFHAEGSILTTLFGLLFWDILFAPVPGSFETSFQSAPLDLGEDSFALARAPLIAAHLARIEAGEAPDIVREIDERERAKQTWCVGVRWDYERGDLLEIVECLGGRSLSVVCRMLCEEYGHRSSGVPDLIVWNHELKKARFVEVKGPGDTLSSTQKVWIDVMLSAGIEVEVCKVAEADPPKAAKSRSATPAKRARSGSAASSRRSKSVSIARDEAADSDEYEEEEKPAQKRAKKSAAPVKKPVKKEIEDEQEDEDEIICID